MKILYAKLTNDCNLSCPHCNICNDTDWNESVFFAQIRNFDGQIIAFGGEPTLYRDRFFKLLKQHNVTSVSTNLMELDDDLIRAYKKIYVSTSWNVKRFDLKQYDRWLKNIKRLGDNDIPCTVLITLTPDLISMNQHKFMDIIKAWNSEYCAINTVLFEHLVDDTTTQEFFDQCDDWLCAINTRWNADDIRIKNQIVEDVLHWEKKCSTIYTLEPNGNMRNHCPHPTKKRIREECLACEYANICQPCILQQHCSFPKKLYNIVKK